MNNRTIPTGTAVPPSGTAIPPMAETAIPSTGTEIPPTRNSSTRIEDVPEYESYKIDGVQYDKISLISSQSGEAKIFRVRNKGKDYALKIYKPNRHPNHSVLDIVMQTRGSGLLVDIYSHGIWRDANNVDYDFELMQYCSGRSLATVKMNGDEKKLKETALRMAAAIDFCHQKHILHRDIKPANFLYVDESESSFVLTDFGIGKILDEHNRTTTDEGRTPIYAAPEMYTYIPGRPTYVTPASDFYAMGMSLLALWMGEGMLIADEVRLVNDKQEETLPYPSTKEMSIHTLSLIKALTRRNKEERAGFVQIGKWAKGEVIFEDSDDAVNREFRIVFSARDNLIAHSSQELARILWENRKLAMDYLYHEQVEKWFREIDRPETALQIHNITENEYPGDREAGLYKTCLLLDNNMPYFGLKGNRVGTKEEVSKELFDNVDKYVTLLSKPTHLLWVYLRTIGLDGQADSYPDIIKEKAKRGVNQLCYELNSDLPYSMELKGKTKLVPDFDALFNLLATGAVGDTEITQLTNDDFLTWVAVRDKTLVGATMENLRKVGKNGWLVAYSIGVNVGYDFRPASGTNKSTLVTIEDVANYIATEINDGHASCFQLANQIAASNFSHTRLYQYLYSKKKYSRHIDWIQNCMNLNSVDNQKKYAPYTVSMAQMKTVAGLCNSNFPLQIAGITIQTLKDYESNKQKIDSAVASDSARSKLLQEWVALHFQEDPNCNYQKTSYYELAKGYLNYLIANFKNSNPACSAKQTEKSISKAKSRFTRACRGVRFIQWFVAIFCFVPLIFVSVLTIYDLFVMDAEVFRSTMESVGNVLGVVIGVCAGLVAFAYLNWLGGILVGWGVGALVAYLCNAATPIVPWILIALLLFVLFSFGRKIFAGSLKKPVDEWSNMDLKQAEERACLGNAFGSRYDLLPHLPDDYPECVYVASAKKVKGNIGPLFRKAIYMFVFTISICFLFTWIEKKSLSSSGSEVVEVLNTIAGKYTGKFDNRNATISLSKQQLNGNECLVGVVTIRYSNPLVHNVVGLIDSTNSQHITFMLRNNDGTIDDKVKYDAQVRFNGSDVVIGGVYTNAHKGSRYNFYFNKSN